MMLLLHLLKEMIIEFSFIKVSATTYYERNRDVILNRAKDYYKNNKEFLREREQKINIENYLMKKKT